MQKLIAVVDFGMGNLRSVSKAFETVGAEVEVTNDPGTIADADAIILPGVGAFRRGCFIAWQFYFTKHSFERG